MYAKGVTSENKFLRYLEKRTLWRIPNSACEIQSQAQDNILRCPWGLLSGPLHYAPPTAPIPRYEFVELSLSFLNCFHARGSLCLLYPVHLLRLSSGVISSKMPFLTPPPFPSRQEQLFLVSSLCLVNVYSFRTPVRAGPGAPSPALCPSASLEPDTWWQVKDEDEEMPPWKYEHSDVDGLFPLFFAPCSDF